MDLTFTERLSPDPRASVWLTLPMTAEERRRSRRRLQSPAGEALCLALPRGTLLQDGDLLRSREDGRLLRIEAGAESVVTVSAPDPRTLARAAYHLGNRHVALQVGPGFLRLLPDPVLIAMLARMGLECRQEVAPFEPDPGAYQHAH